MSDFFLLLIHSLHEVVDDVPSFAFSGNLIEVSDILDSQGAGRSDARDHVEGRIGSSDYGGSLVDFEKDFMRTVTPKTTVIVLGDARTNILDPRADILRTHLGAIEAAGLAQPRRADGLGAGAIPKCRAMPRSAAWCASARPQNSSSAR